MAKSVFLKTGKGKKNFTLGAILLVAAIGVIGLLVVRPLLMDEPIGTIIRKGPRIVTNKKTYYSNEPIVVRFYHISGKQEEWISIAHEGSSARVYIAYSFTGGAKNGSVAFRSLRLRPGHYEARLHYSWETRSYAIRKRTYFKVH